LSAHFTSEMGSSVAPVAPKWLPRSNARKQKYLQKQVFIKSR
jgi:hypothetical protein